MLLKSLLNLTDRTLQFLNGLIVKQFQPTIISEEYITHQRNRVSLKTGGYVQNILKLKTFKFISLKIPFL